MNAFATAGVGFLLAVLWFDLMFDAQTRGHDAEALPVEALTSISAYYRRVTTDAWPMNRLVALMMIVVIAAIVGEIVEDENPAWLTWGSLAIALFGFAVTRLRTLLLQVRLEHLRVESQADERPAEHEVTQPARLERPQQRPRGGDEQQR